MKLMFFILIRITKIKIKIKIRKNIKISFEKLIAKEGI